MFKNAFTCFTRDEKYLGQIFIDVIISLELFFPIFFLQDVFTMTNRLHLMTPCDCFKEMISNYKFQVVLGEHYGMSLDFKAKMKNEWKNVSNRKVLLNNSCTDQNLSLYRYMKKYIRLIMNKFFLSFQYLIFLTEGLILNFFVCVMLASW
jgi:hypothetical protein